MDQVTIIGIDISKRSFQLHGATAEGKQVFRKMLSRGKFLAFLSEVPPCQIVMEACGGAHHWGRQIIALGHACKLIPPIYVKPFLKRQKNDSNDAAAIVEAAQRPTMRFVAVKSEEAQADGATSSWRGGRQTSCWSPWPIRQPASPGHCSDTSVSTDRRTPDQMG